MPCLFFSVILLRTVTLQFQDILAKCKRFSVRGFSAYRIEKGAFFMKAEDRRDALIAPHCEFMHAHPDLVESAKERIPSEQSIYALSELFKIFGDATRVKILYALMDQELCVCDIALLLGMSQSAISHQLRVLKQASLVKFRREGKSVFYSLADNHVSTILCQGLNHVNE